MGKRHSSIGIKQVIQYQWMEKTTSMLLAGMDEKSIRDELNIYIRVHKKKGSKKQRSLHSSKFIVSNLMKIWVSPDPELLELRNQSLELLQKNPAQALAIHWTMISASYPFWFNVALQIGRLLYLQDKITSKQIISRLKEQYGDRQTVSKSGQYVVRSMIAWGILQDSKCLGCYTKRKKKHVLLDKDVSILLLTSLLHAVPDKKVPLKVAMNSPALFPFQLPTINTDDIIRKSNDIDIIQCSMDEDLLELKRK